MQVLKRPYAKVLSDDHVSAREVAALPDEGIQDLGVNLVWLMGHVPGPDGRLYTVKTLQEALEARGVTVSKTYIGHLRQGVADNPSSRLLREIAQAFNVSTDFFHDPSLAETWKVRIEAFDARKRELMAQWSKESNDPPTQAPPH